MSGSLNDDGRDEMNLVEFPLSAIADRFLDGRKTVVFKGQVWDHDSRGYLDRELAISGSDRYGLPTAKDEDVLLACLQISAQAEFQSREVHFSRYELLRLLRWPDEGKNYQRLATSLRRWKGVTIYSNRAFYDHAEKSWVNRDFGVLDNLYLYEREHRAGGKPRSSSRLVWNEVLFRSFRAGYIKRLDWELYCRLTDPVAKRLYRLLDKRFYHGEEVSFDLHELATQKVRLSENYDAGQIKRALTHGIRELETLWELRPLPAEKRFVRQARGKWQIVFQRRTPKRRMTQERQTEAQAIDVAAELTKRGIGPAMAEELAALQPVEVVRTMVRLFDWYNGRGQEKGLGFLVASIKNPAQYRLPKEFRAPRKLPCRSSPPNSRKRPSQKTRDPSQPQRTTADNAACDAFSTFWNVLPLSAQQAFEAEAVRLAAPTKRDGYLRWQTGGGALFDDYRLSILREHFERLGQQKSVSAS